MLEFKVDDVIDWLWEDLKLPNLQPRIGPSEESEWKREGWDRRGARSRLDRRRSLKESVKRRALEPDSPAFTDEDLRFRQLTRRRQPAVRAAVFFLLDVSGSMSERDRQLSKTFFFWVAAGLRREYKALDIVFVAHTTDAWEFSEADFFKVTGSGGTVASAGLTKVHEIMQARFDPATCNVYLFYASDGDNAADDRALAARSSRPSPRRRATRDMWKFRRARAAPRAKRCSCSNRPRSRGCHAAGTRLRARTMLRPRCATSSPPSRRRPQNPVSRERPREPRWTEHVPQLEELARKLGLDWSRSSSRRFPTAS